MFLNILFILIIGLVNYPLPIRAEEEKKTCPAWTVLQRRECGLVDFNRGWDDYVNGFGNPGDLWLGLESLHEMTKGGDMELEIRMITRDGIHWVAKYRYFQVGPASDFYRLRIRGEVETNEGGNAFFSINNRQFSTYDTDRDNHPPGNCASRHGAGWWYIEGFPCADSNLNGNFNKTGDKGFWWYPYNLLRFSEMKFRKRLPYSSPAFLRCDTGI